MRKLLFLRTNDDPGCYPPVPAERKGTRQEELALQIRGEYLAMSSCAGQAAHYRRLRAAGVPV